MGTKLCGIGSIESIDSSGEVVSLQGVDIFSLARDGVMNFEHNNDLPSQILGKILYAKKIYKEEDCENEEQLYFWNQVNRPYLYVVGELFDEEGHSEAKNVAAIARYSMKNNDKLFCPVLNFSIEGVTLIKKGQKILRSVARRVAITVKPCNKQAHVRILGWEPENKKNSILINISKSEEQRSILGGHLSVLKKAVDSVKTKGFHKEKMIEHTHGYKLDKKGNGKTTSTSAGPKHTHAIINGIVQPAGNGNHTHGLDESNQTLTKLEKVIGRAKTLSSTIKPKRIFSSDNAPSKLRIGDRISHSNTKKPKTGSQIYKDPDTFKNEKMNKALSAGSYDTSPSSLSQGAALQQEDLGGNMQDVGYAAKNKNRALAAYRDWRGSKKGKLKEYLKMEMPDVCDSFIKIFSDLVDKVEFKKTEQVMECIYGASLDQFDWEQLKKSENSKKGPDFKTLKKNKVKLSEEERNEAIEANAVWHPGNHDKPVCAIWKSEIDGKTYYGTNTHRAFNTASTLKGAINKYHSFIKGTA